jgi:uncharacterized caspase-like protein
VTPFPLNGFSQKLPSAPSQLLLRVEQRVAEKPEKSSLEDLSEAITAAQHMALLKEKPDPDEVKRQTEKIETLLNQIGLPERPGPEWKIPQNRWSGFDEGTMQVGMEALTYLARYYTTVKESAKAEDSLKHALALGFVTQTSYKTRSLLGKAFESIFELYLAQQNTEHPDLDEFLSKLVLATQDKLVGASQPIELGNARDLLLRNREKLYNLLPRFDTRTISEVRCFGRRKEPSKLRALLIGNVSDRLLGQGISTDLNLVTEALSARGASEVRVADNPSREGVLEKLRELAAKAECGDAVFVYYGGHGFLPEITAFTLPEGYDFGLWLGDDLISGSRYDVIWGAELAEFVTAIRNRGANIFLFLDTMSRANIGRLQAGALLAALDDYRLPDYDIANVAPRVLTPIAPGGGAFAVFYAARPGTYAWYKSHEGSFFTIALAKVLAREVKPTVSQIADAISKECRVKTSVGDRELAICTPVFESSDPNIVFLEPGKPLGSTSLALEISSPSIGDRYPSGAYRIANQKFELAGRVIDAPQFARLIVNHKPADKDEKGNFKAEIELEPGQEKVAIDAIGRDYSVRSQTLEFSYEGELNRAVAAGRHYALVIGIQNYDHKESWDQLTTPLNDAREVAKVLHDLYGFEREIELQGKKRPLLLLDASKKDIEDTLRDVRKVLAENDSLLIYYAGHGTKLSDVDRAYWVPKDGDLDDQHTWISAADLIDDLKRMNARSILIVSDSCFSGAMTRDIPDLSSFSQDKKQALLRAGNKRSRLFMSSGGNEPVLDKGCKESKDAHSVFACAFIKGLRTFPEAIFGARDFHQMEIIPIGGRTQQMPEIKEIANSGHDGGEFIFARVEAQEVGKRLESQDGATGN